MVKKNEVTLSPEEFREFSSKFLNSLGALGILSRQFGLDDLGPASPLKAAAAFGENLPDYMANGLTLYSGDLKGLATVGRYYRELLKPKYVGAFDEKTRQRFKDAADYLDRLIPEKLRASQHER